MTIRNGKNSGIVQKAVVDAIERLVARAIRQRFAPAFDGPAGRRPAGAFVDDVGQTFALDRHIVDIKLTLLDLNAVARQSDDTLDVVGRRILGMTEYSNVAGRRLRRQNAPRK